MGDHFTNDQLRSIIYEYVALYESVLTYGLINWENAAQSVKKTLMAAQNYAVRAVVGYNRAKHMKTKGIYKSTNLRPL